MSKRRAKTVEKRRRHRKPVGKGQVVAGAGLATAAALGIPAQAQATDFTVNNLGDAGSGSLRQAALDATANPGHDRIVFASGLSGEIDLTTGQIVLNDVDVVGPGSNVLTVKQTTANSRVFYSPPLAGGVVSISGLTVTGGHITDGRRGGGISVHGQDLSLTNATVVTGNQTTGKGGGVALYTGQFSITDSTVSFNIANSRGGGIFLYGGTSQNNGKPWTVNHTVITGNQSGSRGGGIDFYKTSGTTQVSGSTITGNHANNRGGGLWFYKTAGTTQVINSTVSGNTATSRGGGMAFYKATPFISGTTVSGNTSTGGGPGGGIFLYKNIAGPATETVVQDSTIAGNQQTSGAAGGGLATFDLSLPLTIASTTISGNSSTLQGGGVYFEDGPTVAPVTLSNTILADNSAPTGPDFFDDRTTQPATLSFDLLETAPAGQAPTQSPANSNIQGKDPQLQPLADNGGPTQTEALPKSSPVVDQGSSPLATDQRGFARVYEYPDIPNSPAIGANGADMGAFELQPKPVTCVNVTVSSKAYKPSVNKTPQKKGVRARVTVDQPSQVTIKTKMVYTEDGKQKTANLGSRTLKAQTYRNLRIVLPDGLADLPFGKHVTLKLQISAVPSSDPTCAPTTANQSVKTKVTKVLSTPQSRKG